jgi:hypothetical protein
MADTTNPAGYPVQNLQGTQIPIPVGSGVEGLQSVNPPFRTNAPPWYTPPDPSGQQSVWGKMGCAVAQPGRYLQTNNRRILDLVTVAGRQLFHVLWHYQDRKFERFASRDCLYECHKLLTLARKRLTDNTVLPNQTPLQPTRGSPSPAMFTVYPVPLYGPLGSVNVWLGDFASMTLLFMAEAMQHRDNELGYYWTQDFALTCYPYIKYLIVDMATKFFGLDAKTASDDSFTIPDASWAAYNPAPLSVSVEGTSTRPPMGWTPTDLDLEPIRGLPIQSVIPFLQPWPDSVLRYSSGGIWAQSSSPAGQALTNSGQAGTAAAAASVAAPNTAALTNPNAPPNP